MSLAPFPHFLWSNDGRYFAECNDSTVFVRDTETFDLVRDEEGRKRSLKYDNLATFQWSPKDNILAIWTKEHTNVPARLVLVEIPSRAELAARSRTQVEAELYWQSEGDFLCLQVTKLKPKSRMKVGTNLEIFRIREKNIPVDIVELSDKEIVRHFSWETAGSRFAIIHGEENAAGKVTFYQLGDAKCEIICSLDLPSKGFSDIFWAPAGQYFVCTAMNDGDLIFGGLMPDNKLEILNKEEHFMVNNVLWDPSSRYVITAVTQKMAGESGGLKYQMEAGYQIWTFQGRLLHKQQKEKLYHVAWRPHPPSLLSTKKQNEIRKNLKQFSRKYDAMDEQAKEAARQEFRDTRKRKTDAFLEILDRLNAWKEEREEDEELAWPDPMDGPMGQEGYWEKVETTIEEELDATEELIQ